MSDRLYFRQLLCGRDIAAGDAAAAQMANQVYAIGDRVSGDAVIVDPAWAPDELVDVLAGDGMRLCGVLVTHHHPDHVGGSFGAMKVAGLAELLTAIDVPVHAHRLEADWVARTAGLSGGDVVAHDDGEILTVGEVPIEILHTPGHTPGSQCFLVAGRLVAGDTLFLNGCGRTDLPGSDPEQMYQSLQHRLSRLPGSTVVYPGHLYSEEPAAALEEVRAWNPVLKPRTPEEWLRAFGG